MTDIYKKKKEKDTEGREIDKADVRGMEETGRREEDRGKRRNRDRGRVNGQCARTDGTGDKGRKGDGECGKGKRRPKGSDMEKEGKG